MFFDFKFVSGVFEKTSLRYTPLLLSKAKPFLFDSQYKYIVPVEFNSEVELQDFLGNNFNKLDRPTDYIIMRVEKSKKGNGLGSFMEYLACEYFKTQGLIVENQIPLAHAIGSPDFGGYDLSNVQAAIKSYLPTGFHIIELAMLRFPYITRQYESTNIYPDNLIVGEAKTSTKMMDSQLRKYLDTGLFDWGIEMHPNKRSATRTDRGTFSLDESFIIRFTPASSQYRYTVGTTQLSKADYIRWLENYMKFYLIANFTNDELNEFYKQRMGECISTQYRLSEFVQSLTAKEIITQITNFQNGIIE